MLATNYTLLYSALGIAGLLLAAVLVMRIACIVKGRREQTSSERVASGYQTRSS